jgi:hypothetical protein
MSTTITITNSGQTATPNPAPSPDAPQTNIHRIIDVYFAKKTVTTNRNILTVAFTRIDSAHTQQDADNNVLPYDCVLGKTVYLIIETANMRTLQIDATIQPNNNTMTGNTDHLSLMRFNYPDGGTQTYDATNLFTVTVGNFDALKNRDGNYDHYTNMDSHRDKAIIKLQIRPQTIARFNTWARNIAATTVNIEVSVKRTDNLPYTYGATATEEVTEPHIFLNTDAAGRFRIVNRNIYSIYHGNNAYNFFAEIDTPARQRRVGKVLNTVSSQIVYFYFDQNDNEHRICERTKITVIAKRRVNTIPPITQRGALLETIDYTANQRAGEQIDANRLLVYERGTLGDGVTDKWYANQGTTTVELINMDILENAGIGAQIFLAFDYNRNAVRIRYGFQHTRRRSIKPDLFAGFLGALAQFRQEGHNHYIVSQGFSFADASCYPSAEHVNGEAGDINLLTTAQNGENTTLQSANFDYDNLLILRNLLYNFGFESGRSENFENRVNTSRADNNITRLPNTTHTATPRHNNHLHVHGFNAVPNIYD